ncbi:MAG TPA: class I SAM-dependent methyltransferase [Vicinamibacterales bacterium]|jgi:predicted O-methyltransferase YrrM
MNTGLVFGSPIDGLLERLYARNLAQDAALADYFTTRANEGSLDWNQFDERTNTFLQDKLVALDRSKAEFCYHVCRALGARRVVEAGTSFGVSTIFLAAAVRDNLAQEAPASLEVSGHPIVIATENEPRKTRMARGHFAEAGLSSLIDLREGDLRETLQDVDGPVDFMLIDIWTPMAQPVLGLIGPRLREGAVVICDNTQQFREAYREYFEFIDDPRNGLRTMTLPFEGGLEFTVRAR